MKKYPVFLSHLIQEKQIPGSILVMPDVEMTLLLPWLPFHIFSLKFEVRK